MQAHIPQHIQIAVIGEGYVLHDDIALDLLQVGGVFLVLQGRLGAHDVHKPVQTGKAVGEHFGKSGDLAHGADKGGDVQREGQQVPIVHVPLHDEIAADADDHHIQAAQEKFDGAVEPAHGLVKISLGCLV